MYLGVIVDEMLTRKENCKRLCLLYPKCRCNV